MPKKLNLADYLIIFQIALGIIFLIISLVTGGYFGDSVGFIFYLFVITFIVTIILATTKKQNAKKTGIQILINILAFIFINFSLGINNFI